MDFYRRRRKPILLLAAIGFSAVAAYKIYHLPSVSSKRKKLYRLLQTLISVADAVSSTAETVSLVSSDLNRFLRSYSDEIPGSLKQMAKIARSDEFVASLSRVSEALTVGIVRGFGSTESSLNTSSSFSDRVLDKLLSPGGSGFASVVVGSFARNLVIAFYSRASDGRDGSFLESSDVPGWIHLLYSDKSRELIANCIQLFVSTAVAVYLDKTMEINTYDEFFSGLTNPKHEAKVKEILVSVCNGAVETLVKTSHQVLTESSSDSFVNGVEDSKQEEELSVVNQRSSFDGKSRESGGWIDQVSSTLAVPSNRSFVLDVTGRVTFESVRSFLDFLLSKLYDCAKRGIRVVREEVVERGLQVVRYFSAKSMVVVTVCLALCMHVLDGSRVLMPA